jgi:hypothetical protein
MFKNFKYFIGNPLKPKDVGSLYIIPGERIDFVINANQNIDNYWIRVKGAADCSETSIFQTAILKYEKSPPGLPKTEVNYENAGPVTPNKLIFNPFNQEINEANKNEFLGVDDVRSSEDDYFSSSLTRKLSGMVNKKFYFSFDMNLVKNTVVYDDLTWSNVKNDVKPWASPQINK